MKVSSSLKQLIFLYTHTHTPITLPLLRAYADTRGNKTISMYNLILIVHTHTLTASWLQSRGLIGLHTATHPHHLGRPLQARWAWPLS